MYHNNITNLIHFHSLSLCFLTYRNLVLVLVGIVFVLLCESVLSWLCYCDVIMSSASVLKVSFYSIIHSEFFTVTHGFSGMSKIMYSWNMRLWLPACNVLLHLGRVGNEGGVAGWEGGLRHRAENFKPVFCKLLVVLICIFMSSVVYISAGTSMSIMHYLHASICLVELMFN
jgi:hypothetical protein